MLGTALALGLSELDPRQDPGAAGAGMQRTDNSVTAALAAEASQLARSLRRPVNAETDRVAKLVGLDVQN